MVVTEHLQKVTGYLPADGGMKKAFSGADIVVIPAGIPREIVSVYIVACSLTDGA